MDVSCSPMAMANPHKLLCTSTILWEALKIPFRNLSLFIPILCLSLISSSPSLIFLENLSIYLALTRPICNRVTDLVGLAASIRGLSILKWILLIILFIILSLVTTATIHAISMTYSGKHPTLSDVVFKTKHAWKGAFVTQICITILHLGFVLSTDPILLGLAIISRDSKFLIVLLSFVAILAVLYYLYVALVSLVCLVVSAIEDECYGETAIGRALELICRSRKQGVLITLLLVVLSSVATVVFMWIYSSHSNGSQSLIGFIHICTSVVLNLIILATSTVLYYECKKSKGEEDVIEMEGHLVDASLFINAYVVKELP